MTLSPPTPLVHIEASVPPATGALVASPVTPLTEPLPEAAAHGCPAAFAVPVPRFAMAFLAAPHLVPIPFDDDDDLLAHLAEL